MAKVGTKQSNEDNGNTGDEVLGLNVGGKVFYCSRSTLTSHAGSYFAAKFGGRYSPGGIDYCDEFGRNVYFIDRDPVFFEHVLAYLRTKALPCSFPVFSENPALWRSLRMEAEYFGLDGLSLLLQVTHSCPPDETNRGLLHWLGTDKGRKEYQNPFTAGIIHVGGWVDIAPIKVRLQHGEDFNFLQMDTGVAEGSTIARANFVQHQFKCFVGTVKRLGDVEDLEAGMLQRCGLSGSRIPIVVDLRSIMLRPTHYSLRYTKCNGMQGNWNFEASIDGHNWDIVHAAREDRHIKAIDLKERKGVFTFTTDRNMSNEEISDFVTSYMEQYHRHTWTVSPSATKFYRYFRIIGADTEENSRCLHGAGLEMFGDVYQE